MRVIVCGSRRTGIATDRAALERAAVANALDALFPPANRPSLLIHGAAKGVDTIAGNWAENVGVPVYAVKAEWSRFGDNAGPMRNAAMLLARPDFVVAFPGGDGTANMKDLARRAGVAVVELELNI